MKTRSTIPCSRAELRPNCCQRLRQWVWLLLATLGVLLAGAEGALAQTAPNCLTVICPPDVVTNFTCSGVYVPTSYPIIISNSCPNSPYAVVCNPPVGTPLGVGAHPVNCVISAGGVVSAFCHFTIVVETDDKPPVINCPSNIVETACPSPTGGCAAVVNYPAPSAFDNSGIVTVTCVPPSGSVFPCGTTTVNCQAVDRCQLTDQCSFTVTVTPSGNTPVILCPPNMLITTCSNTATVTYSAAATPSGSFVNCTPPSGSAFPFGVTTVTCLASNDCGTDTCSFSVTVVGVAPASIQCPANVIVSLPCGSNCVPVSYSLPLVNNGGLVACTPAPGTCLPTGVFPVTCVATNLCRQPTSCTFEIRVTQGQGQSPTIVCPSNIVATVDCGVACLPVTYPAPVVGNGVLVSCNPPSGFCFPPGVSTVTCVASNACASTACSFVVRVVQGQGQGPSILCPSNIVVDTCRLNCDVVNYPAPSVVNGVLVNCFPPSGSCFPLGVSAVTCVAANACATNTCTFPVTVRKIPPPSIQCPTAPVIMEAPCLSNCVPIVYALPGVGNGTLINCSPAPGTCLPVGVYNITCRATNVCGVTNVCSFPLEVRPAAGQNPPVFQCPTLPLVLRVPCDTNCIPLAYTPPPVSNGVLIGCNPPPGTCLPLGNYTVTCRASNLCNTVECAFAVNVLPLNNQPPSISCPTNNINVTAPCGSNCVNVSYALPAVSNGLLAGCVPPPNFCFPLGVTTVTCRATNDCKLVANCSFAVVVSQGNGELPVITCPTNPPVLRVPCTTNCVPLAYPLPVVANGTLVNCSPAPGTCLPVGLVNVVCFASNVCGTAVCEFPVSIEPDLGLLHIDCPTNRIVTLPCGSNCVPVTYTPPTVPVGVSVSCTPPSGTCLPLGIYVVSCTATNDCGALSKCEFQVRVVPGQGEPPSIHCPSNIVVTAPCGATCLPVFYPPPTVSGGVLTGCSFPPGFCFPLGSTTVFCRATNLCGAATCSFVVTVLPSTTGQGPGIQCPSNVVLQLPCGTNCAPIAYPPPVVTGGTLVNCTPAPGTCLPAGLYNVVCVATNGCGDAVCEFPLRIVNSQGTLPALKCPTNMVVRTCDTACEIVNYPPPFVGLGVLVGCNPPSGSCFPLGFTTVTCVATNACGTNACSFVVNVRPEPYPQLICPSNIMVTSCSNGAVVTYAPPVVTGSSNHFGVYCSPPSGSFFPVGSHVVSCCVTDVCDRVSCCEFTVTVRPSDPCVKPPLNMVLWLPFDEVAGPVANNIIAGTPDGLHVNGPVPVLGQYVLNSLRFDGSNDLVRVPAYGAISLPNNNFTIDAWVRRETPDQGRRVIVSKIQGVVIATGGIVGRGRSHQLSDGKTQVFRTKGHCLIADLLQSIDGHLELDLLLPTEASHLIADIERHHWPAFVGELLGKRMPSRQPTFLVCESRAAAWLDIALLLPSHQQHQLRFRPVYK